MTSPPRHDRALFHKGHERSPCEATSMNLWAKMLCLNRNVFAAFVASIAIHKRVH